MHRLVLEDNYGDSIQFYVENGKLYIEHDGQYVVFLVDDATILRDWLTENIPYINGGEKYVCFDKL